MASAPSPVDKLHTYLSELTPEARALLLRELERGAFAGERIAGLDLVLEELRSRQRGSGHLADRLDGPERRLFLPLAPFLVDEEIPEKLTGRIVRSSLPRIWSWLYSDALPAETAAYGRELVAAQVAEAAGEADRVARAFRSRALAAIETALAGAADDAEARRRMVAGLWSERILADLADVAAILRAHETLARFAASLPVTIENLTDHDLTPIRALLEQPDLRKPDVFPYALMLLFSRLAVPVQLLRLAAVSVDGHAPVRIAGTPHAFAVDLVFDEVARAVARLEAELRRRRAPEACAEIAKFHELARGLAPVVDAASDARWIRRLARLRSEAAAMLRAEIDGLPERLLRLLRPRTPGGHAADGDLDARETADIEAALEILSACGIHAGETAFNDVAARFGPELQSGLDAAIRTLIEAVREADPQESPFRLRQLDAAMRFAGKVFGGRHAELFAEAAEAAAAARPRAARA